MEVKNILNKCGHRNNERVEALKKIPSGTCPACELERFNDLKAELKKKDELLFALKAENEQYKDALAKKFEEVCQNVLNVFFPKIKAENKRLREVLVGDKPYNLSSCLTILISAATHLLEVHNCDGHGYEKVGFARDMAVRHRSNIEQALKGK